MIARFKDLYNEDVEHSPLDRSKQDNTMRISQEEQELIDSNYYGRMDAKKKFLNTDRLSWMNGGDRPESVCTQQDDEHNKREGEPTTIKLFIPLSHQRDCTPNNVWIGAYYPAEKDSPFVDYSDPTVRPDLQGEAREVYEGLQNSGSGWFPLEHATNIYGLVVREKWPEMTMALLEVRGSYKFPLGASTRSMTGARPVHQPNLSARATRAAERKEMTPVAPEHLACALKAIRTVVVKEPRCGKTPTTADEVQARINLKSREDFYVTMKEAGVLFKQYLLDIKRVPNDDKIINNQIILSDEVLGSDDLKILIAAWQVHFSVLVIERDAKQIKRLLYNNKPESVNNEGVEFNEENIKIFHWEFNEMYEVFIPADKKRNLTKWQRKKEKAKIAKLQQAA